MKSKNSAAPKPSEWRPDGVFLGLVAFLVFIDLPYFLNVVMPFHDNMSDFLNFYVFYNDFYFNNEIPRWLPFGFYGLQSDFFYISQQSPAYNLIGLIGSVLRIENAFFVFKSATFFSQLIFLYGTYLLSKALFKHRVTHAFVGLIAVGSIVISTQFSFRAYYLLPLTIYLLIRYFSTYKIWYAVLVVISLAGSPIGSSPYIVVLPALSVSIMLPFLIYINRGDLHKAFKKPGNGDILASAALVLVLVALAASYYYFVSNVFAHTEVQSQGRDPETGLPSMDVFLTWGGDIGYKKFVDLFYPGYRLAILATGGSGKYVYDSTIFVGFICLILAIYAISKSKNLIFYSFGANVLVFGLFSLGDMTFVATLLHDYFPLMKYYRHIGYSIGNYKLFLPLMAGFGLDHFMDRLKQMPVAPRPSKMEFALLGAIILGTLSYAISARISTPEGSYSTSLLIYLLLVSAGIAFLFLLRRSFSPSRHFAVFLIFFVCLEMAAYQGMVDAGFRQATSMNKSFEEDAFTVNKYGFYGKRTVNPTSNNSRMAAVPLVAFSATSYAFSYNFMQFDPCVSQFKTDLLNKNTALLIRARNGYIGESRIYLPNDEYLLRAIGCESPKLKLVSAAVFAEAESEAVDAVRKIQDIDRVVVLDNVPKELQSSWKSSDPGVDAGDITVNEFGSNKIALVADVSAEAGAWLYYADSYHPGWKGYVNGKEVPIARANLAFKALKLGKGRNEVKFVYYPGLMGISGTVISAIGTAFMLYLLLLIINEACPMTRRLRD